MSIRQINFTFEMSQTKVFVRQNQSLIHLCVDFFSFYLQVNLFLNLIDFSQVVSLAKNESRWCEKNASAQSHFKGFNMLEIDFLVGDIWQIFYSFT